MAHYWPPAPHDGGSLTLAITESNYRRSSLLRRFDNGALSLISIVKNRYWDRGAGLGGPGLSCGAWVNEGFVWLRPYPFAIGRTSVIPPVVSPAGWGWSGEILREGEIPIESFVTDDDYLSQFQKAFWTMEEAISYANGGELSPLAEHSEIVDPIFLRRSMKSHQ